MGNLSRLVKGRDLTPEQVAAVKRAFIYRLTTENGYPQRNPFGPHFDKPTVAAVSDAQWIDDHAFYITKKGELSNANGEKHAEPAWMAEGDRS